MELTENVIIQKPVNAVWNAIIDIKNCSNFIEGITKVEVIDEQKDTLVGFKWK